MDSYSFKFKFLNESGAAIGFRNKSGSFDGETLRLDDQQIAAASISQVAVRDKRVILAVTRPRGEPQVVALQMTGGAQQLADRLGRARSAAWARRRKEQLEEQGRGGEYRSALCPNCGATLDLSSLPRTPQVFCEFCDGLSTLPAHEGGKPGVDGPVRGEEHFKICEECGMYSKPRRFTIFYFYFLLVIYGYWHNHTWRCPACMRPEAWKMFFGNLLFVLGVPVALVQLFRAYGGSDIGGLYAGLDRANLRARGGRFHEAIDDYRKLLEKHPAAAGVKYNIGLAFLHDGDLEGAVKAFEFALGDCANYHPAVNVLVHCYDRLGETDKAAALKQRFAPPEPESPVALEAGSILDA